jgi:hypothetical protein
MKIFSKKEEIEDFFRVMQHEDISFHPDKKLEAYVINDTQERRYDDTKVSLRKALLDQAFEFCKEKKLDIYQLYRKACLQVDVEAKMREHIPVLFELLGDQTLDWNNINTKFSETHLKRLTNHIHGNNELVEANFFDVLTEHWKGNKQGTRMLNFFTNLLKDINRNLDTIDKKKIKKTLYSLLIESDLNYLNYVAELAVLNLFVGHAGCKLNKIESPLGNKKSADFLFDRPDGNGSLLIEVVSVRPRIFPKDEAGLKLLFEKRFQDKNQAKTEGDGRYLKYFLVPVIWGSADELKRTADFIKSGTKIYIPNVTDYCAYCTFSNEQSGGSEHRFGSLMTMFG